MRGQLSARAIGERGGALDRDLNALDRAEEVALVANAKRNILLRANRHRLRWEDLEDCYSQATLELIVHAQRGGVFANRSHLGHALALRFSSRIRDRRRALAGRSPAEATFESAISLSAAGATEVTVVDRRAELEALVVLREELRRIERLTRALTQDQRLVLSCQLAQVECRDFCDAYGWSPEKYRKVAQRARARLRRLVGLEEAAAVPLASAGRS